MNERRLHHIFRISVAIKGVHALAEIAGGIALAFAGTGVIVHWLDRLRWLGQFARHFTPGEHDYYTFFFITHGIVNLVIVIGLWREKLWAYPATFAVLSLFIAYQLFRFAHVHDPGLIALSALDLIVMALAWNEYRLVKARLFAAAAERR